MKSSRLRWIRGVVCVALAAAAGTASSSCQSPDEATPAAFDTPDAGSSGASLTSEVSPGIVVRSESLPDGDVRTEITEESTKKVLAFALAARAKGEWSYSLLKAEGESQGRGDVRAEPLGSDVSLAVCNERLVARFTAGAAASVAAATADYSDYGAPGCDYVDWWIDGSQHCAQDCCADLSGCFGLYMCDSEDWFPMPGGGPKEEGITDIADVACKACMIQGLACMGKCGLLPESLRGENYGDCAFGEHRCFDARCMDPWDTWAKNPNRGLPVVNFYCAQNCYTDPSPCDPIVPGEVWCSAQDNDDNNCRDAYGREGFYAPACDPRTSPVTTTCECERQGLVRCKDDRCEAGQYGYCSRKHPDAAIERDPYGGCDPADTNNPCCGGDGQPCCEGQCEGMSLICDAGSMGCVACGDLNERPCLWGCQLGLEEFNGTCQLNCGGQGETCCGGVCGIGLLCTHPTNTGICGFIDTLCSDNPRFDACEDGDYNHMCGDEDPPRSQFRCKPCGQENQVCCPGESCNGGLTCEGFCRRLRRNEPPDEPDPPEPGTVDLFVEVRDGVPCADTGEALIRNLGDEDAGPFGVGVLNIGPCATKPLVPPGKIYMCPGIAAHGSYRLRSCALQFDSTAGCVNTGWRFLVNGNDMVAESDTENNAAVCSR